MIGLWLVKIMEGKFERRNELDAIGFNISGGSGKLLNRWYNILSAPRSLSGTTYEFKSVAIFFVPHINIDNMMENQLFEFDDFQAFSDH